MSKSIVFSLFVLICIFAYSNASFQARFLQPKVNEVMHKATHTAQELTLKLCMKVILNILLSLSKLALFTRSKGEHVQYMQIKMPPFDLANRAKHSKHSKYWGISCEKMKLTKCFFPHY